MDKKTLRKEMRTRRRAVSGDVRAAVSHRICGKLLANDAVRRALSNGAPIAVYLASLDEIDLSDFIVAALERGAALAAPRWTGSCYEMVPLKSMSNLVAGPHGILEPASDVGEGVSPNVWILPGLAFTASGKRMGYGGGWYDRFLAAAEPSSVKLGVAYEFQVVDDLPTEDHDMLLDGVITG